MLVLHIKFKETVTIGSNMEMKVIKNNDGELMFELKAPENTLVVLKDSIKEANNNLFVFGINYKDNVYINDSILVKIVRINNYTSFKLCIDAPKEILIFREKTLKKLRHPVLVVQRTRPGTKTTGQ